MGFLDKITANLKLTELKKNSLQKALFVLLLEWKDLEEHLGCIQQPLEECLCELESREKHLVEVQQSVAKSSKELETCRQSIERKENKLRKFQEELHRYVNLKGKQLFAIEKSVQESVKEIELREEKINAQQKAVEGFFGKIELEQKQFEPVQESIRERLKEISLKEAYFESRLKEIYSIQNWIERRAKELDAKEEALDLKEKHLDSIHKEIESNVKQLDCVPNSKDQQSEEFCSADTNKELIHDCFMEFQSKKKQFQLDRKLLEERSKELELRERQLEDRLRELAKQKKPTDIVPSHVEIEQVKDVPATNLIICPRADFEFNVTKDVRELQFFLSEDHDSLSGEVVKVLQLSVDPAKLVLDAMEGFYPPNLKKSEFEFGGRLASVFDADELLKFLKVAAQYTQTLELCRLLNLADKVPVLEGGKKVLGVGVLRETGFLDDTGKKKQNRYIHCLISCDKALSEKILFSHHCKEAKERNTATITHIKDTLHGKIPESDSHAVLDNPFLNSAFPPRLRRALLIGVNDAIHMRVAALRDIVMCIVDYKIVFQYSPATIEKYIEELIMKMADNKCTASAPSCEGQKQQKNKEKCISAIAPTPTKALTSAVVPPRRSKRISIQSRRCMSSNTTPISTKALATASIPPKAIGPIPGTATALPAILAKMDGKNLLFFLNQHFEDLDLMCSDVCVALQMSSDPGNLVLNALQGFHFPHQKTGHRDFDASVIRSSCILLLEQLMRISPDINSQMKQEALELALHWKEQMRIEADFSETLVFLQLVGTYRLVSSFEANELLNLFKNVAQHKCAPELCQVLGFSQRIPDFVQNLIQKEKWLQAVRYIYAFQLAVKFPPVPLLKSHLSGAKELSKKICEEGHNSQEAESRAAKKELASLRDVTKCIADYGLELESSAENLRTRIEQLERQKNKRKQRLSMPIAQDKKKYHASVSILSPKFQSEKHQVEKHPQVALPEELSSAVPVNAKQSPPQLERARFTEQVGPCFGAPNRQYTPAIRGAPYLASQHAADERPMPHLGWQYRSDVAASWGIESSGFSGNHSALYNAPPYLNSHPSSEHFVSRRDALGDIKDEAKNKFDEDTWFTVDEKRNKMTKESVVELLEEFSLPPPSLLGFLHSKNLPTTAQT
ncbi:hypothetical protein RJ639_043551 [Escallonia herrerae]|uniref:FRIGIDA-like protein n=1 Tax=Escallonia herrerae TaxID=1293975 RepID=A0AA89B1C8_9ASTE|nr:hypothetical protein RJ639_043551 [Escallonia herrerae]